MCWIWNRGPLPSEIYWRRRGLAIGIAVVVVAILVRSSSLS